MRTTPSSIDLPLIHASSLFLLPIHRPLVSASALPHTHSDDANALPPPPLLHQPALASPPPNQVRITAPSDVLQPGSITTLLPTLRDTTGGGSSRAGLFRTPISGGVQSATLAHRLPVPAVAVRNLMEQARFAYLSSIMSRMHHRRRGYPYGSYIDFAPDASGHPIFSLSPLAIHTRNVLANPRCSLLVQNPGWSGLANARVTIFGDVYPLNAEQQEQAHNHFMVKHQQTASHQWRNFDYFRMEAISDIYFIGGFGTVAWVDVKAYESAEPDVIAKHGSEQTLKDLNNMFSEHLRKVLSADAGVDDAAFISIDSKGMDVRVRQGAQYNVQRLSFCEGFPVETLEQATAALETLLNAGMNVSGNS